MHEHADSAAAEPTSYPPRPAAQYLYLIIAIAVAALYVALWVVDTTTPADIPRGVYDTLRVATILAGCGYLVRSAASRLEVVMAEKIRQAYATGFVDGITARGGDSATVRSIR